MHVAATMNCIGALGLLLCVQTLPAQEGCDRHLDREAAFRRVASRTPTHMGQLDAVSSALYGAASPDVLPGEVNVLLDSLHRVDSASVGWALVFMAADEVRASPGEAHFLMEQYGALDGAIEPIVERGLAAGVSPGRWATLLTGASVPVDSASLPVLRCLTERFESVAVMLRVRPERSLLERWDDGIQAALRSLKSLLRGEKAWG